MFGQMMDSSIVSAAAYVERETHQSQHQDRLVVTLFVPARGRSAAAALFVDIAVAVSALAQIAQTKNGLWWWSPEKEQVRAGTVWMNSESAIIWSTFRRDLLCFGL